MTHENWTEAQYSVLGSVLIEPALAPKVLHQTRLADYTGPCQTVYSAIRKLFQEGKPVDVVSLAAELGDSYRSFLVQLMEITPTAAHLNHYISLVREQSKILSVQDPEYTNGISVYSYDAISDTQSHKKNIYANDENSYTFKGISTNHIRLGVNIGANTTATVTLQVEIGLTATEYETPNVTRYTADAAGNVTALFVHPTMVIFPDTSGVMVEATYQAVGEDCY